MTNVNDSLRVKANGTRSIYMKEDGQFDKFMETLSSGLENKVALHIMRAVTANGYLRLTQAELAKNTGTSSRTVRKVFSKAVETEALLPVGRRWYLNPYVILPYNLKDEYCNKLQQQWGQLMKMKREKGKVTLQQALIMHEAIFGPKYASNINPETGEYL